MVLGPARRRLRPNAGHTLRQASRRQSARHQQVQRTAGQTAMCFSASECEMVYKEKLTAGRGGAERPERNEMRHKHDSGPGEPQRQWR